MAFRESPNMLRAELRFDLGPSDSKACPLTPATLPKLSGEPDIREMCREGDFGWPEEGGADSAWKGQQVKSEAQVTAGSSPGRQGGGGHSTRETSKSKGTEA